MTPSRTGVAELSRMVVEDRLEVVQAVSTPLPMPTLHIYPGTFQNAGP